MRAPVEVLHTNTYPPQAIVVLKEVRPLRNCIFASIIFIPEFIFSLWTCRLPIWRKIGGDAGGRVYAHLWAENFGALRSENV